MQVEGSKSKLAQAKTRYPISKITKAKRDQVAEYLPSKLKVLSSNPSTTKQKRKINLGLGA
jgi:hypothetical protein